MSNPAPNRPPDGSRGAWTALALITGLQLTISLLQQAPAALGPLLVRDLGLTRPQLGLLTSAIWGGMLLGTLPAGLLVDRHGERRVVVVGVVAMAALVFLSAGGAGFAIVFSLFLLSSVGAAASSPGGTKAIAAWFPRHRLGAALGIRQTGVMAGGLVGALLLPPLALAIGWRHGLRLAALLCLAGAVTYGVLYREPPAGGSGLRRQPLRLLLRNRVWLAATGYGFVFMGALGAGISYLALYLHERAGLSIVAAGAMLALFQVGGLVGRLGWGILSDRAGRRAPSMVAVGVIAILTCAAFSLTGRATPIAVLAVLSFLLGISILGWNALSVTLISESVPVGGAATATGANLSVAFAAMFLVSPFFGYLADHSGYTVSWLALTGWVVIGTLIGLTIRERPRDPLLP